MKKKTLLIISLLSISLFFYGCGSKDSGDTNLYTDDGTYYSSAECLEMGEDITCGKDGYLYSNECLLDFFGSEKADSFEVVDGNCVYDGALNECQELEEDPVCGKDLIMYYNECFLEKNGVEKSENAYITDVGVCEIND